MDYGRKTITNILQSLVTILTNVVTIGGILKDIPDLRTSSISRINSKFEKLKKLESHLERNGEAAVRLQRKLLNGEAMESLNRSNYVRLGMASTAIRQRLGSGCASKCLIGFEAGIAAVLGWLYLVYSQKNDDMVSLKLLLAFFAVLLIMGLTVAAGARIYAHITLNRQFRFDMRDYSINAEGETGALPQETMDRSFESLVEYEGRRSKWKLLCFIAWLLLTFVSLAYAYIVNDMIPVQPFMDLFGLGRKDTLDRLGEITACTCLCSIIALLITAIRVSFLLPEKKNRDKVESTEPYRDDTNHGNRRAGSPARDNADERFCADVKFTLGFGWKRRASKSSRTNEWWMGVVHFRR